MEQHKTFLTSGYTMLPIIWPGSILEVAPFNALEATVGDIVCYFDSSKRGVARRIVRIDDSVQGRRFHVKGDGENNIEELPAETETYVVHAVANRGFSFSTTGAIGKTTSKVALSNSISAKVAKKGLRFASRVAKRIKIESPF